MSTPTSVFVECREWFDKTNGNAYYSARVSVDGVQVFCTGPSYGYESQFEYDVTKRLAKDGYIREEFADRPLWRLRDAGVHVYAVKYSTGKRNLWPAENYVEEGALV